MPTTVSNTTAISMGTGGSVAVLSWIFTCIQQGHIVMPNEATIAIMAAGIAPVIHLFKKLVTSMIERWTGVDLDDNGEIGNGHAAPPAPATPGAQT